MIGGVIRLEPQVNEPIRDFGNVLSACDEQRKKSHVASHRPFTRALPIQVRGLPMNRCQMWEGFFGTHPDLRLATTRMQSLRHAPLLAATSRGRIRTTYVVNDHQGHVVSYHLSHAALAALTVGDKVGMPGSFDWTTRLGEKCLSTMAVHSGAYDKVEPRTQADTLHVSQTPSPPIRVKAASRNQGSDTLRREYRLVTSPFPVDTGVMST